MRFGWLFPDTPRELPHKRHWMTLFRALHLVGIAGFATYPLFGLLPDTWWVFVALSVVTGLAMMSLELHRDGVWLVQLRGISVCIKLLLLMLGFLFQDFAFFAVLLVILVSGYFSHAPAQIRYYVPVLGRVVKSSAELQRPSINPTEQE